MNRIRVFVCLCLVMNLVAACGSPATVSPDAINTAIAQTQVSQALAQATVNANALTAIPLTPTAGAPVDTTAISEEELVALIEQTITEAVAATEQTSAAATTSASDDAVTAEEVAYVYDYYYYAEYYVEYAEELMADYYDLYSDLALEMITEMNAIENQLGQMNDTLTQISTSLEEINTTLSQGAQVAQESIAKLKDAAQQSQTKAQELKTKVQELKPTLQQDQQGRLDQIAQIQPNNIPTDKLSALHSAFDFMDAAKLAFGDNKISRDELLNLTQLGKNAQEGFKRFGNQKPGGGLGLGGGDGLGLDLTQFSDRFGNITDQLARGRNTDARGNLGKFETSLGKRPSRRP